MKPFVYFGTPYVARDTLAALLAAGYRPALVVTSPDRPRGRGLTLTPSETKELARTEEIPVLTPEKITPDVVEEIQSYGAGYALVVAYGKILPQALIDAFPKGALNVHYSLLPKYRGASPVEAALLNGETVTGVTIQQMVYELDAGDVLASREVPIDPLDTTKELRPRLIKAGSELLLEVLPSFEDSTITPVPQDPSKATHSGKIKKEEGLLDLSGDPELNWRKYRAYAESPGTYFFEHRDGRDIRMKITKARLENGAFVIERVIPEGKKETVYEA